MLIQKAFHAKDFGAFILWIWYSELRIEKGKSLPVGRLSLLR
jgi:hypothetical protein